jgi:hypothetical protein
MLGAMFELRRILVVVLSKHKKYNKKAISSAKLFPVWLKQAILSGFLNNPEIYI